MKLYGSSLNMSTTNYGMAKIPSGYTMRTTTQAESWVRTLDPKTTLQPTQRYHYSQRLTITNMRNNLQFQQKYLQLDQYPIHILTLS